jgi:hypothetical protein
MTLDRHALTGGHTMKSFYQIVIATNPLDRFSSIDYASKYIYATEARAAAVLEQLKAGPQGELWLAGVVREIFFDDMTEF